MGRSSKSGKKGVRPVKKSKFNTNNDIIISHKNPPGSGRPGNYLYGMNESDTRRVPKRYTSKRNKGGFVVRKGKKKGKKLFIAKFPVIGTGTKAVPWFKGKQTRGKEEEKKNRRGGEKQQEQRIKIMNALSVNASAMQYLDQELEGFATYVRLSQTEKQAREYLVSKIQESCKNLFGVEDSHCQVFGSFAAQSVCIFESDIDLAIWGVVEPDDEDEDRDYICQHSNVKRNVSILEEEKIHPNRKKQERVIEWKALIDNVTKDVRQDVQVEADDLENERKNSADDSEDIDSSTFVIDRTGETIDISPGCNVGCAADNLPTNAQKNDIHDGSDDDDDYGNNNDLDTECDSTNDDNADKLENFWSRSSHRNPINVADGVNQNNLVTLPDIDRSVKNYETNVDDKSSDDEEEYVPKRRPRGHSLISLSSSTTCSVEAKLDESGMEVSFVIEANNKHEGKKKIGPSGRTRTLVINSLYKLTRPLRQHAKQMNVRRKARVPIINIVTHFGFECDIAIGGHNGTDTSSYASNQMARFKSFPVLVVLLKVLLSQQGLDKPFTGGLGSYALYVLAASHIEQHLALGGDDNPAEILYTFFFRYGAVKHSNPKMSSLLRTELSQDMVIETQDGGSIDMKSCFQVENCVTVFGTCWRILHKRLSGNFNHNHSILHFIIDATKLEIGRSKCKKQVGSKLREIITGEKNYQATDIVSYLPRPSSDQRNSDTRADKEAKELIKGYGQNVETFIPVEEISKQRTKTISRKKIKKKKKSGIKPVHSVKVKSKPRRTI